MLHFLLIGGVFYLAYILIFKQNLSAGTIITLSNAQLQEIKTQYKKEYHTPISNTALQTFINYKHYENILFNEALALNIDSNATDVREDVLQKMEYILANTQKIKEPSEKRLKEFYIKHLKDYSKKEKISFVQIYFPYNKKKDAKKLLKMLRISNEKPLNGKYYGFSSKTAGSFTQTTPKQMEKIFGKYFTQKLLLKPESFWIGPMRSKIGEHLIYITDITTSSPYPFNDVEDRVYKDLLTRLQIKNFKNSYKNLARKYKGSQ